MHGFLGSGLDYAPIAAEIPRIDWYTPDISGEPLDKTLSILKSLIEGLGLKKSILLGYSMGGRIALHLALHYPELFRSVILIGASPGIKNPQAAKKRSAEDEQLAQMILEDGLKNFNDFWAKKPIIASQINIPLTIRKEMAKRREEDCPIRFANCLRNLGTGTLPHLWDELKNIDLPVFLIIGQNDQKFSEIAHKMKKYLKRAEILIVPNAGHAAHLENMPYFIDMLPSLIAKNHP